MEENFNPQDNLFDKTFKLGLLSLNIIHPNLTQIEVKICILWSWIWGLFVLQIILFSFLLNRKSMKHSRGV